MAQLRETTVNGDLTVLGDIKIDRDGEIEKYSLYPKNSIYYSSSLKTNEELVREFGGEKWELIDKEFKSKQGELHIGETRSNGVSYIYNSEQKKRMQKDTVVKYSRAGHNLTLQIKGGVTVNWKYQSDLGMILINLASIGIKNLPYEGFYSGVNPSGTSTPVVVVLRLTDGSADQIIEASSFESDGKTKIETTQGESALISLGVVRNTYTDWTTSFKDGFIACDFNFTIPHELMLDSACDKFIYKRVE